MADPGFYEIAVAPIQSDDSRILARQIVSSAARGEQQLGSPNIVSDSGNARIRVKDATTNRVTMGNIGTDPSSATNPWGLKVSKPGYDVLTATDDQIIFDSQRNMFKIVQQGTVSMSVANPPVVGTTYQGTVVHNLGYAPGFMAYINTAGNLGSAGGNIGMPWSVSGFAGTFAYCASTTTSFFVYLYANTASNFISGTWTFTYYLMRETAA